MSTFWIVWTGGGQLCLRRVIADPTGLFPAVRSDGPTILVPHADVGAVMVRAQDDVVYIMYSSRQVGTTCDVDSLAWYMTSSGDGGLSWSPSSLIHATNLYDPCIGSLPVFDTNNGNFGFDIAPDGTLWAAVHDTHNTIRVLRSVDGGSTWTTSSVPSGTAANVGQPWLVTDLAGNVAVTYYRALPPSGTQLERWVAVRDAATGTWAPPLAISLPITPSIDAARGSVGRIGDYQGATAIGPEFDGAGSFYAVWTEDDSASPPFDPLYRIEGSRIEVAP